MNLPSIPFMDACGRERELTFVPNGAPHAVTPFRRKALVPGKEWRQTGDFLWYDGDRLLRFRSGYEWDGASVPWAFQWYEGKDEHLAASGPHDAGYQYHFVEWWTGEAWTFSRVSKAFIDRLWAQILRHHYGVRVGKVHVLWAAVCGGGWWSWLKDACTLKCESCRWKSDCPYAYMDIKIEGELA